MKLLYSSVAAQNNSTLQRFIYGIFPIIHKLRNYFDRAAASAIHCTFKRYRYDCKRCSAILALIFAISLIAIRVVTWIKNIHFFHRYFKLYKTSIVYIVYCRTSCIGAVSRRMILYYVTLVYFARAIYVSF